VTQQVKEKFTPMVDLENREKIISEKIRQDEQFRFRLQVLTTRLFASWVADVIGFGTAEKASYIDQVIDADFAEPGFDDVLTKVYGDLLSAGIEIKDEELRMKLDEIKTHARNEMMVLEAEK